MSLKDNIQLCEEQLEPVSSGVPGEMQLIVRFAKMLAFVLTLIYVFQVTISCPQGA